MTPTAIGTRHAKPNKASGAKIVKRCRRRSSKTFSPSFWPSKELGESLKIEESDFIILV